MAAETHVGADDLRAAVAAGIVTEAQAAGVLALAQGRAGQRAQMRAEDEPFEFFRGFSEIFIATGLSIFLAGVLALLSWVGVSSGLFLAVPLGLAVVAWWMAGYFTLRRRMVLPSLILAAAFGGGIAVFTLGWLAQADFPNPRRILIVTGLVTAVGFGAWYWRFRLPVAMFMLGLACLGAVYGFTLSTDAIIDATEGGFNLRSLFDLRGGAGFGVATLLFGVAAFVAGMWFDTRDPHRLGRHAATGFWLHLLAAPALVNTVALTLYNTGGTGGMLATAAALAVIAVLALVIDRRSFLTAGIVYIALLIGWAVQGADGAGFGDRIAMLLILGAFITALGTWWVPLRAGLMRALPAFPGKTRLPPYGSME